jgi:hypothetical protein
VKVTIPVDGRPSGVTLASPDASDPTKDTKLEFTYSAMTGTATTTIPSLLAYDVIIVAY